LKTQASIADRHEGHVRFYFSYHTRLLIVYLTGLSFAAGTMDLGNRQIELYYSLYLKLSNPLGIRQPLKEGTKHHEWKAPHGFRKFYKSRAEQVMKPINVEITMGHDIGISASITSRPNEMF
jgi:hypothetical protein